MITKAIVEEIVDKYNIRVRVPLFDRTTDSSVHTSKENLNVAIVCTLPGCNPNIRVGDVVFISKEPTQEEYIILGYLYRSKDTGTYCDLILNDLTVNYVTQLPFDTTIGTVSPEEIQCLEGVRENIQKQFDDLTDKFNTQTEDFQRQIDDVNERLIETRNNLQAQLDKHEERLNEHDQTLEEHDSRIEDLEKRVDGHDKDIEDLRSQIGDTASNLESLINELVTNIEAKFEGTINNLLQRINDLEAQINIISQDLTIVDGGLVDDS